MSRLKCLGNKIKTVGNYSAESIEVVYGYLYNWWVTQEEVTSSNDWIIPSLSDYNSILKPHLTSTYAEINNSNVGRYLMSKRMVNYPIDPEFNTTTHPRWNYNVNYGFDGFKIEFVPSGSRGGSVVTSFIDLGSAVNLWTTTNYTGETARYVQVYPLYGGEFWSAQYGPRSIGFCIRLVRNASSEELSLQDGTYCADYIGNDGKRYKTVKIGTQVWLAVNLAETKYRNGDLIPFEATGGQGNYSNAEWRALITPARCAYNNTESWAIKKVPIPIPLRAKYI